MNIIDLVDSSTILAVGHRDNTLRVYFRADDAPGAVWEYDCSSYDCDQPNLAPAIYGALRTAVSPGSYWSARWRAPLTPHGRKLVGDDREAALADLGRGRCSVRNTDRPSGQLKHSPGPWIESPRQAGAIIAPNDQRPRLLSPYANAQHLEDYGGPCVCESILSDADRALIAAAPLMLQALALVAYSPHEADKWRMDVHRAIKQATVRPDMDPFTHEFSALLFEAMQPFPRPTSPTTEDPA